MGVNNWNGPKYLGTQNQIQLCGRGPKGPRREGRGVVANFSAWYEAYDILTKISPFEGF